MKRDRQTIIAVLPLALRGRLDKLAAGTFTVMHAGSVAQACAALEGASADTHAAEFSRRTWQSFSDADHTFWQAIKLQN